MEGSKRFLSIKKKYVVIVTFINRKVKLGQTMKKVKWDNLWLVISIITICIINLWDLSKLYSITIVDDEFGYVAMAAQMAGYDWTTLLSTANFYSYGYGLILAVLFKLGLAGRTFYQIGVIVNVFMLVISFLICRYLAKEIIGTKWDTLIALAINLYSANLLHSRLLWAETTLYMCTWILFLLIYMLYKKHKVIYALEIGILSVYMHIVHQRALSVIIASCIVVTYILLFEKKEVSYRKRVLEIVVFVILMTALVLFTDEIKQFIVSNWYVAQSVDDGRIAVNDYSGQVAKVKTYSNIYNLLGLILGMIGKMYAQSIGSFMFILFVVIATIRNVICKCMECIKEKRGLDFQSQEVLMIVASLLFLGALGVASVYKSVGELANQRYYEIIMTRYIDYVTGPMLLFGFYMLKNYKKYKLDFILSYVSMIVMTGVTYFQFLKSAQPAWNVLNVASVCQIMDVKKENLTGVITGALFVTLVSGVVLAVMFKIKQRDAGILIAVLVLGIIWSYNGITLESDFVGYKQQEVVDYEYSVYEYLETKETDEIYYVQEPGEMYNWLKIVQSMRPGMTVYFVNENEISNLKQNSKVLMARSGYLFNDESGNIEDSLILKTDRLCVYSFE